MTVDTAPNPNAPQQHADVTAQPHPGGGVELTWTVPPDDITGWRIERATFTSAWQDVATLPADPQSYIDAAPTPGQSYFYRVVPLNAYGEGVPSNVRIDL
jgi:hypothetical protein